MTIPYRLIDATHIEIAGKRHRFYVLRQRESTAIWLDGRTYYLPHVDKTQSPQATSSAIGEVTALMPGKILRIDVSVGDTVTEKQNLAIMESMKMETTLQSPKVGRVTEIRCQAGQVVDIGDILI